MLIADDPTVHLRAPKQSRRLPQVLSRDDDTRPQDVIDLRNLLIEATVDDIAMARSALGLIAERGYDRGKSLQADLDALLARFLPDR